MSAIPSTIPALHLLKPDTVKGFDRLYKALEQLNQKPNPKDYAEFMNTLVTVQDKIPSEIYEDLSRRLIPIALNISQVANS